MQLRSILSIAVLGIVFAAAGCARKPNDAALVTNIKAQMFSDPQLKGASLQVTAKNGQVTLTGTVPNDAARLDAYKIATQAAGVSKVTDRMAVAAAQTAQAETPQPSDMSQAQSRPEPASAEAPSTTAPIKSERKHHRSKRAKAQERETASTHRDRMDNTQPRQDAPAAASADAAQAPAVPAAAPSAPAVAPNPTPAALPAAAPPPPPQPAQVQIPAGTTMSIRMIDGIDSSVNQPGEIFHASLDAPIVVDGQVVVPKNADVYVRLASVTSAGHIKGRSELELQLVKLEFQGQSYPLTSSTYTLTGSSRGKDTAKKVGAGAILGTLIGAIAGGGKGAAVGAAVGAGAGGAYQEATRGKQVNIPSETKLAFQLEKPVTVMVMPHSVPSGQ